MDSLLYFSIEAVPHLHMHGERRGNYKQKETEMKEKVNGKTVLALIAGMLVIGGAAAIYSAVRSTENIEQELTILQDDDSDGYYI
jgi:hypothetical protein